MEKLAAAWEEGDFARFMPTICHFVGIPVPGGADDSIQT